MLSVCLCENNIILAPSVVECWRENKQRLYLFLNLLKHNWILILLVQTLGLQMLIQNKRDNNSMILNLWKQHVITDNP